MLETIAKGFIIGILTSSPMGPINMLVIQRTLNRGSQHGLVSGMGAVLSDLIYALITVVGLSFVSDFLTDNERWIQIAGSIILIIFGLFVFRSNPLKGHITDMIPRETRYVKDFISSFFLTFSNPAIILVLIGLNASFSFNPLSDGWVSLIAGLVSFIAASILWWFFLTAFVSMLSRHFNRRGLVMLNLTVGLILMLLGVGGIVLSLFPDLF
jgi:threonine/homoserine/homoserine lactone efflux protein